MTERKAIFGVPAVWDEQFAKYEAQFLAIERVHAVGAELLSRKPSDVTDLTAIVISLLRVTGDSMFDVLFLVGNKRGFGAIKIARSMFEAAVTSSYLLTHPTEVADFVDFGSLKSAQLVANLEKHHPGKVPPELLTAAEAQAAQVRPRFTDRRGRVRSRWSAKTIREMAEDVQLLNIYEIAYGLFSDIHHLSMPGLISHEIDWCVESLHVAHGSLLATAATVSELLDPDGRDDSIRTKLRGLIEDFNGNKPT